MMPRNIGALIGLAYSLAIFAFIFLPVIVLVTYSFQGSRLPVPPFDGPSLKWYGQVFGDRTLTSALANSLGIAAASSAVSCALGFLAALGLARQALPGAALMRSIIIAPLTVSYLIIGLGLLASLNAAGFRPSLLAVGIGHAVINTPLCFAIIFSQTGSHQINFERAARDLGASELRILWHVSAPVLAPAILASYFLSVTFSWDEFIIAFLLSRFEVTLPVEIWSLLRSGLSPKTNAVGSIVFLSSVFLVFALELLVFRKRRIS